MAESTQHVLDRVRPPRVQITYDVEIGGAIQMKELPLVVGILADLVGQQDVPKLKERKFIQIDRDNFNDVMAYLGPKLKFAVPDKVDGAGNLPVELVFRNIDDFHPVEIAKKLPKLRDLLEKRQRLIDLLAKLDGNEELTARLQELQTDEGKLNQVKLLAEGNKG